MNSNRSNYNRILSILIISALIIIMACDGEKARNFNESMSKISKTAKAIDTFNSKVSTGVTKFSKHVDEYIDTNIYQKDTSGKWVKKK